MHIALYSAAWPAEDSPNGIVTYVHNLRGELIRQGHRVSVFCSRLAGGGDSDVHLVPQRIGHLVLRRVRERAGIGPDYASRGRHIADKINEVHRRDPIDIIEMEEFWGWCATVKEHVAVPVVVKLHGPAFLTLDARDKTARRRIEVEGEALRKIDTILAPSQTALAQTTSHYNLEPRIRRVIPNPLTLESDERWDPERCERKTILFVGRFDKLKGGDTALLAFRRLLEVDPGLQLVFAGPDRGLEDANGARVHFDQFRDALFAQAQRSRIRFLGQVPRAEVSRLRTQAMVTILVSRWENQPNTALEAMLQGCPVVAYAAGGLGEIIEHERTGLLARAGDIDDLCRNILRVLEDPALAQRLGANARARVIERHGVKKLVEETVQTYRDTISLCRACST